MKRLKQVLVWLLVLSLVVSTTACGTTGSGEAPSSEADGEPTVITIMLPNVGDIRTPGFQDDHVAAEVEKRLNIKLEILDGDDDKRALMLAANELPDILIDNALTKGPQYINSGYIINFDDYLDKLPNIQTDLLKDTMQYWRDTVGGEEKGLYFLPTQTGGTQQCDVLQSKPSLLLYSRWDMYAELGYPEINNLDDYLNVLKQMQDANPTTEDGRKTYALGGWVEWGLWPFYIPFEPLDLDLPWGIGYMYGDPTSRLWQGLEFYNKAWAMGIVDPDIFIMKYDEYMNNCKSGKYLTTHAGFFADEINAVLAAQPDYDPQNPVGFTHIPSAWPVTNIKMANQPNGLADCMIVPKNTKNLDKVLEFINFAYSYEGSRLMATGVEGTDWVIEDGKPKLTDEAIKSINAGGAVESGIDGKYGRLCGLAYYVKDPEDGGYMRLSLDRELAYSKISDIDRAFSEHYGVNMPSEVDEKLVSEGKIKMHTTPLFTVYRDSTYPQEMLDASTAAEQTIVDKLPDLLQASPEEFQMLKQQIIDGFMEGEIGKALERDTQTWADAQQKAEEAGR